MRAGALLASAARKAAGSPEHTARVAEASLPMTYVLLARWDDVCAHATETKAPWPVLPSKRAVFERWAASFNASVSAIHGPWDPKRNEWSWKQWGENRCAKACWEAALFANASAYPECRPAAVSTDAAKDSVLAAAVAGVTAPLAVKSDDRAATADAGGGTAAPPREGVALGRYPIATLGKQLPNMIENWYKAVELHCE